MDGKQLERIENKLDVIFEHLFEIRTSIVEIEQDVAVNKDSLVEHMRRTNLLEEQMEEALKPIEWAKMTAKLLAWVVPIVGAIVAIYYQFK